MQTIIYFKGTFLRLNALTDERDISMVEQAFLGSCSGVFSATSICPAEVKAVCVDSVLSVTFTTYIYIYI
jgi:hypothetical protein